MSRNVSSSPPAPRAAARSRAARRFLSLGIPSLLAAAALVVWFALEGREPRGAGTAADQELVRRARSADALGSAYPGVPPGTKGIAAPVGPPLDLAAIASQVHYAYRLQDGAWRGGHTTYAVALRNGELEVKPYHRVGGGEPGTELAMPPGPPGSAQDGGARIPRDVVEGSAVRFKASRIERGGTRIAEGEGRVKIGGTGGLEIDKGGVTERLANGPGGVEQSWTFDERPAGSGDVVVRLGVAAGRLLGASDLGLHFTAGDLAVRYGHATWIDALGIRTHVPARFEQDGVVLSVPASTVEGSVFPAVLDPEISPEVSMDEPVNGVDSSLRFSPVVTRGRGGYLVVWTDDRSRTNWDIYGARVSETGALLDPTGIPISTASFEQETPAVAWDGNGYLVVWRDYRARTTGDGYADVYGARVSEAGAVLDVDGFAIATGAGDQSSPALAWDGSNYLVVWHDRRKAIIAGAQVSAAGTVLDRDGFTIAAVYPHMNWNPAALAWDGSNYLVVWSDLRGPRPPMSVISNVGYDLFGARVSAAGTVLDPVAFAISAAPDAQWLPRVAWDGSNHLVVWQDHRNAPWSGDPMSWRSDVYGARVSRAGTVLDPAGIPIAASASAEESPRLAWDGSNHLVVWFDRSRAIIAGARVSAAGTVLDPDGLALVEGRAPDLASDGSDHFLVWTYSLDPRRGGTAIRGTRVSAAGTVVDPVPLEIAVHANEQFDPALASDGSNYLVVWLDDRAGGWSHVYGARLSATGSLLDPAGIPICTAPPVFGRWLPAVASGEGGYLVVWQELRKTSGVVLGARVSASGAVLDPDGFVVAQGGQPAVAWDGTNYVVVWGGSSGSPPSSPLPAIRGARVSPAGTVHDPEGITIAAPTAELRTHPSVASNGSNLLVAWHDFRNGYYASCDLYGARLSKDGVVLDPDAIPISTISGSRRPSCQGDPKVSSDGRDYLVVWFDERNDDSGAWNADVYGARVSEAGAVLDPDGIAISTAPSNQIRPAVAWDGNTHLVVWQDRRSGTSQDIYGARVSKDGALLDPEGIAVSGSPFNEWDPSVVASGSGGFVVAYSAFDDTPNIGSVRVAARSVVFDGPPLFTVQPMPPCPDADGDGFAVCGDGCEQSPGTQCGECDDSDAAVSPGAVEGPSGIAACSDGIDNDCDGLADGADPSCAPPPRYDIRGFSAPATAPARQPMTLAVTVANPGWTTPAGTITVWGQVRKKIIEVARDRPFAVAPWSATTLTFTLALEPRQAGAVTWFATVTDGDEDVDEASATTIVTHGQGP